MMNDRGGNVRVIALIIAHCFLQTARGHAPGGDPTTAAVVGAHDSPALLSPAGVRPDRPPAPATGKQAVAL